MNFSFQLALYRSVPSNFCGWEYIMYDILCQGKKILGKSISELREYTPNQAQGVDVTPYVKIGASSVNRLAVSEEVAEVGTYLKML
jgi:hypothetical protein